MPIPSFDAIILGAGAAGLSAADRLVRAGRRVAILEARDCLGGRIATVHPDLSSAPVELGAQFIHGRPAAILDLAAQGAPPLVLHELTWHPVYSRQGRLQDGNDDLENARERLHRQIDPDRRESYADFLRRAEGDAASKTAARLYVEGFHAADTERISAVAVRRADEAEAACEGEKMFRLTVGYNALVHRLAANLNPEHVFLNTIVEAVTWGDGTAVSIRTRSRGGWNLPDFTAACLLVTLPVGVLQAGQGEEGAIRFQPELPPAKRQAIAGLASGAVVRVTLELRQEFWRKVAAQHGEVGTRLEFVQSEDPLFPVWWTEQPLQTGLLTAWAGGPRAERLLATTKGDENAVVREAVQACARVFGVETALVEQALGGWHFHDWTGDPFARGAYSYLTAGHEEASRQLAEPLMDRLFFAGEATHWEGENGTVHGAISSGQRAGREILRVLGQIIS